MKSDKDFLKQQLPYFCLALFVVATTVGVFTGGLWAGLGIGGAIVMFLAACRIEGRFSIPRNEFFALALLSLGVTAVLNCHSSQPQASWRMWERLATIFLPLCLLSSVAIQKRAGFPKFFACLAVAAMAGAFALGLELYLHGPLLGYVRGTVIGLTPYNRGFSYLAILAFAIAGALFVQKRHWLLAAFALVLLFPFLMTDSRSAQLGLMAGLAVMFIAQVIPPITRYALMILPFGAAAWPFIVQKLFLEHRDRIERLPNSWHHRMEIWDYMSYHIREKIFWGWGLGSSNNLPFTNPHPVPYTIMNVPPPHPHNSFVQLWVELGLPGIILGILFCLLLLRLAGRLKPSLTPFALGAWMAGFSISLTAYDLWSDSLWAAFALTAFAFALLQRQGDNRSA